MENLSLIGNKLNELFITVRYKYIKQNEDGSYITFNKQKNSNHVYLNDGFIKSHLLRQSTYGVFCSETHTKFITFDVDVPDIREARRVVLALYYVLNSLGIPSEKIFSSWSGTKGYHVDIYFSRVISNYLVKKIFDTVILETYNLLDGKINGQIELRPTHNQGVKLPLSINSKNKDARNNICWYIDVENNFTPIYSPEYILTIEPIEADLMEGLIKDLPDLNYEEPIKKKTNSGELTTLNLSGESPNSIAALYKNGLKKTGIRNSSLCKLAVYFNTLKVSKIECEQRLRKWMDKQDKKYYKTPLETCYKEITRIVNSVYKNNITLSDGRAEIVFTKSEMLTIEQYPKKLRLTLNALLIHSKRFGDRNSQFYMTYEQIASASHCSIRTAINHIKILEKENLIKVIRLPKENLPENHPNTYELNLKWLESEEEVSVKVNVENVESYLRLRTLLSLKLFPNNYMDEVAHTVLNKNKEIIKEL
jgi:hypothetical protein